MSSTSTPTIIDLRGSTKETESSYIEGSSRESYTATLVLLIMFLFDSSRKEILFSQDALAKFEAAHNKDKGKTDRRNLRKAAKEVIGKLGNPSYCPIIVDKITYSEDISAFMNSKKKIVQVHKDLADEWRQSKGISRKSKRKANTKGKSTKSTKRVRHDTAEEEGEEREEEELEEEETDTEDEAEVEAEVLEEENNVDGDLVNVIIPLSLSVYTNIQSSVSFLFRECGVLQPAVLQAGMAKYVKGMKRRIRRMKQVLALKISEGKIVMTRDVYHFISRLFLESEEKEHIFARLFFSLDWYGHVFIIQLHPLLPFSFALCLLILGT